MSQGSVRHRIVQETLLSSVVRAVSPSWTRQRGPLRRRPIPARSGSLSQADFPVLPSRQSGGGIRRRPFIADAW